MFIELEAIFNNEGEKKDIEYSFDINDDALISSSVNFKGTVFNRAGIVYLSGNAGYDIKTVCAMCAAPVSEHRNTEIEHILIGFIGNEDDYDKYIVVDDMKLELDELIREDIFLSFPMRFVCNENCRGLCPVCGADLNRGQCGCKKPTDARWDILKDLF